MQAATHYSEARFYFMSGTGNSYRVADWMKIILEKSSVTTSLIPIDAADFREREKFPERMLLGVFLPTHAFTAPWSVIKFALRLMRGKGTHAIVVATQGRLQFRKFFIPGLSGTATFLTALILALKGYRVRGVQSINMPSNWMALHSAQKLTNIEVILDRARIPAETFTNRILSGRRSWWTILNVVELLLGTLLFPISIGYNIYGKELLAKLFFTNSRCNGCGLCAEKCPNRAIKMLGKKRPLPFWTLHCESCMRCMGYCPEKAIEVHQPIAFGINYIASVAAFLYVIRYIGTRLSVRLVFPGIFGMRIFHYAYFILVLYLFSKIFFRMSRFRIFNRILTATTLTPLYRRYHDANVKIGELSPKMKKFGE